MLCCGAVYMRHIGVTSGGTAIAWFVTPWVVLVILHHYVVGSDCFSTSPSVLPARAFAAISGTAALVSLFVAI